MANEPFAFVYDDSDRWNPCFNVRIGEELIAAFPDELTANCAAGIINAAHDDSVKEACEKVRSETLRLCAEKAYRMGSEDIRNAIMFEIERR